MGGHNSSGTSSKSKRGETKGRPEIGTSKMGLSQGEIPMGSAAAEEIRKPEDTLRYLSDAFDNDDADVIDKIKAGAIPGVREIKTPANQKVYMVNNSVVDVENQRIEKAKDWLYRLSHNDLLDLMGAGSESSFWDNMPTGAAYHATPKENVKSIMKHGIGERNKTRGISNRGVGSAVFASMENDERLESYGDAVFEIHLDKMKKDGYMPEIRREPGYNDDDEEVLRERLAHLLGVDNFEQEREYGIDPDTLIIHGSIPPEYIKRVGDIDEDEDQQEGDDEIPMGSSASEESTESAVKLSATEEKQLGTSAGKKAGYSYIKPEDWPAMREYFLKRSMKRNPKLNPELTAYTPGETLGLLEHPEIKSWNEKMKNFKVPEGYGTVVFVPCAATKPWTEEFSKKSELYKSYNEIIKMVKEKKIPPVYFVTISEPLGIVPQDRWGDFPQYDNPGLFKDEAQRSGLFTRDWVKTPAKEKHIVPFDSEAYKESVDKLSDTIAAFMKNNQGHQFISFVENPGGKSNKGTHSDMLDGAVKKSGVRVQRNLKKAAPGRASKPKDYILEKLSEIKTQD